jgi:hypothetical protein
MVRTVVWLVEVKIRRSGVFFFMFVSFVTEYGKEGRHA